MKEKTDTKKEKGEWEPGENFDDHHVCCSLEGKDRSVKCRRVKKRNENNMQEFGTMMTQVRARSSILYSIFLSKNIKKLKGRNCG